MYPVVLIGQGTPFDRTRRDGATAKRSNPDDASALYLRLVAG